MYQDSTEILFAFYKANVYILAKGVKETRSDVEQVS